jgi:hypothetical protein
MNENNMRKYINLVEMPHANHKSTGDDLTAHDKAMAAMKAAMAIQDKDKSPVTINEPIDVPTTAPVISTPKKRLPKPDDSTAAVDNTGDIPSYKYSDTGPDVDTKASKGEEGWNDIHGWNFKGDKATADKLRLEIEKVAADYGVPPRALSFNNKNLTLEFNPEMAKAGTLGRYSTGYAKGRPPSAKFTFGDIDGFGKNLPHEMGHHIGAFLSQANALGGTRITKGTATNADTNNIQIAGLGGDDDHHSNSEAYLKIADKYYDKDNNLDVNGFRKELYDNVFNNPHFNQRPMLKHTLADTVSYILSDEILLKHTNNSSQSWNDGHEYVTDPEELWGQAFQAFSDLKRRPSNERFTDRDVITPETFNKIQTLMNTLKVVNGNTLAKTKTTDMGARFV